MRRLGRSYTSRPESSTAYNKKNDEKEQAVEGQGRKKPAVNMGPAYNKEDEWKGLAEPMSDDRRL